MFDNVSPRTDRRTFLQLAGIGLLGAVGAGALTGCGTRPTASASGAASVELPSYTPLSDLVADLAGTADGVPAGFYSYPTNPVASVAKAPLDGETFTAITNIFGSSPRSRADNPAWQAVEKGLGGKLDITSVPSDDYTTKLNTIIAGGDLPDFMLDNTGISDILGFLESKCQDLSPFLSGDAVSDYPNLAAIPEVFWKQCTANGKIYKLPIPRNMTGGSGFYNATYFSDAGVDDTTAIGGADDYLDLLADLTSSSAKRWALGSSSFGLPPFYHMFRVPNTWREDGGELTHYIETDEYLEAISFAEKANAAGYYYPGSEGWTKAQMVNAFVAGEVAQIYDGMPAYLSSTGYAVTVPQANPDNVAKPFVPFGHDGGDPGVWLDNIVFATVMLKENSDENIRKLLGVADYLAAPFGSSEYLLLNYGVEGTDYTLDANGNPVATEQAALDVAVPWKFIAAPQQVVYDPTSKDIVKTAYDAYSKLIPGGVEDPCGALFSATDASKGSSILQSVTDTAVGFIAGRNTIDDVKDAVATWRTSGGDDMRDEYEKTLAANV